MRKRLYCVVVAAVASLTALTVVSPAYADEEPPPTARELLEKCDNGTDSCVFHPAGLREYFTADRRAVGNPVSNCTDRQQFFAVDWSDTTAQSNSVGLTMTIEKEWGKVFALTYEQTYRHTWEQSHTETQQTFVTTDPFQVGWVERAPQMQKVKGTYELRFPDKFHDHYIWYVPIEISGPAPDPSHAVSQHARPMTEAEKAHCP